MARKLERCSRIHCKRTIPAVSVLLPDRPVVEAPPARIVDEDRDRAQPPARLRDRTLTVAGVTQIGGKRLDPGGLGQRLQALLVPGDGHHANAPSGEHDRRSATDAPAGSGDDRDAVGHASACESGEETLELPTGGTA